MHGFDQIAREEFSKALKAIDERMAALRQEHVNKHHMPAEDAQVIADAWMEFMNQVDRDFRKNVGLFFADHQN